MGLETIWEHPYFRSTEKELNCSEDSGISTGTDELHVNSNSSSFLDSSELSDSSTPTSAGDVEDTEPTLMIHFTTTKVRVTALNPDGSMQPLQNENEDGHYSTPLWMALINNNFFKFGPSVLKYALRAMENQQLRQRSRFWDLGMLLLDNETKNDGMIVVNKKLIRAPIELLLGLYLQYLKSSTEKVLNTGVSLAKVVFCVPLWFQSLHRQRLKDSATLMEFREALVINETSCLAITHLSSTQQPLGKEETVLVLAENSGNVDLAVFKSVGGISVEMLACAGNLYMSSGNRNQFKLRFKKFKEDVDSKDDVSYGEQARELLFISLWKELTEKIPEIMEGPMQAVILCEDHRWKYIFEKKIGCHLITYDHLGAPPVLLREVNTLTNGNPPTFILQKLGGIFMKDQHPYEVYRSEKFAGKGVMKLRTADTETNDCRQVLLTSVLMHPNTTSVIFQKNVLGQKCSVGTINVTPFVYFQYPAITIHFTMERDGTIHLDSVSSCTERGESIRTLKCPEEYQWTPTNLPANSVQSTVKDLQQAYKCGEHFEQSTLDATTDLWELCDRMAEKLFTRNYRGRLRTARRISLEEKVNKILQSLQTTFDILVDFELEDLKTWKKELEYYDNRYLLPKQ